MVAFQRETEADITAHDLTCFERTYGLKLPRAYKKHMIKYNGGCPEDDAYFYVDGEEVELDYFFPLRSDLEELSLESICSTDRDPLPAKHLTIGTVRGGYICLNLSRRSYGSVHIYDSEMTLQRAAGSFCRFLWSLRN